jgi:hypothetical protein
MANRLDTAHRFVHCGQVPNKPAMVPFMALFLESIPNTTSAFTDSGAMVMNLDQPVVCSYLKVIEIEEWLTTLEETMEKEASTANRRSLEGIYFMLKAARRKHLDQHQEIQEQAPTADDLQAYLSAYAAAIAS